ncbi:hypothetical protein PV371_02775 [Streptomyces sp. TX20-6-3]|uniref:hypothetical protein n=1 Tax=Streptomyces sp. TX20-6-3 TaxID=3028705 RepID=UPI0029BD7DD4|nr:hypothetical protein [Streptomyces sp. TX20-6-3]MDX2558578.1 hypothetical protein [Streptomyces sp. TX20-6-3]
MTACAIETTAEDDGRDGEHPGRGARPAEFTTGLTITANGAYAARLAGDGDALYVERWTLDGPEPYAVPLPLDQPEEPGTQLLPLADGRVLVARRVDGRRTTFSLLYPTGPATGELRLGSVEAPGSERLVLLPPSPDGICAYALCVGPDTTTLWLVAGGAFGPEQVAEVKGRCGGGVWLDRTGRMLALDRRLDDGPVKAVAVDLERGGEVTPLLQITEDSDDRLLLADPDSGLLLIRSDAPSPGHDRLGWGVLGSLLPVRFPECLRLDDAAVTPFAVQPGQVLMPETCAVALRIDAAGGSWVGTWQPMARRMGQLAAPVGWLAGAGLWTAGGVLRLPYVTPGAPCGLADVEAPPEPEPEAVATAGASAGTSAGVGAAVGEPRMCRPVPLQQAPLTDGKPAG